MRDGNELAGNGSRERERVRVRAFFRIALSLLTGRSLRLILSTKPAADSCTSVTFWHILKGSILPAQHFCDSVCSCRYTYA